MIVVFDASVLIFLFEKDANAPTNPITNKPLERCYDRVNHLVSELQAAGAKIVVPTPALAEVLVKAGNAAPDWLKIISTSKHFSVAPFDMLAAVEHAALQIDRPKPDLGEKRKIKFDDQIFSIARVVNASVIYSSGKGFVRRATSELSVVGVLDLPLPPEDPQGALF